MDKAQCLNAFWSEFGLIAYDETSVPDNAELPYITYETAISDFDRPIPLSASVWYRSSSWTGVTAMADRIIKTIGKHTRRRYTDGGIIITLQSPEYIRLSDSADDMIRRIVINVTVEFVDTQ